MRILPLLRLLAIVLLLALPQYARTQTPLSGQSSISLLTCGPGDELYSVFGHTAIRVYDPATLTDIVYNYGTFDFSTPNFYLKFVKGDLKYFVSASSYTDFVSAYQYYGRDVFEQKLNLTQAQKQNIANELAATLISEDRFYTYKYFHRNCTTMVGDVLQKNLPVTISQKNEDSGKSYRKIVIERLDNSFYENLGISLIFGYKTDTELHNLFLPVHLMQGIDNTKLADGTPLAQPAQAVVKGNFVAGKSWLNNYYTCAFICLLLMIFSSNIIVRRVLYTVFGLLGVFFCFVGLYSFHTEVTQNYNALLINPLFLLMLYFSLKRNAVAERKLSYVLLGIMVLYVLFMLNKPHLFIMLPLIAVVAVMLVRQAIPLKGKGWQNSHIKTKKHA
ncbi:DUF4105 domain-containing protein [Flavobacterium sp. RHBU_24]|uniref:lipoprotein N-acyltransferase Lnb domain-containing protein n=1 Tax=Flavobacterium sp. RHBU_24 TaxID=3391185 RepID=UPI00398485F7